MRKRTPQSSFRHELVCNGGSDFWGTFWAFLCDKAITILIHSSMCTVQGSHLPPVTNLGVVIPSSRECSWMWLRVRGHGKSNSGVVPQVCDGSDPERALCCPAHYISSTRPSLTQNSPRPSMFYWPVVLFAFLHALPPLLPFIEQSIHLPFIAEIMHY